MRGHNKWTGVLESPTYFRPRIARCYSSITRVINFPVVQNIDGTLLINNVIGLTKTAKVFGVPTVLTTVP